MKTNRNQSNGKKAPTANKLQVIRKNQKSLLEEFGAEVNHGSTERNQKSKVNQRESERTAWH